MHEGGWRKTLRLAEDAGFQFEVPERIPYSPLALRAQLLAREVGLGTAWHDTVLAAYWEQGEDIGQLDVLLPLAREVGLDPNRLERGLRDGTLSARQVAFDHQTAADGINLIPVYRFGDQTLFAPRLALLRRQLRRMAGLPVDDSESHEF